MEIEKTFKEDIQILKDFDEELKINSDLWCFYFLDGFSTEKHLGDDNWENYGFNILFFKDTFIIQVHIIYNDQCEYVKTYYHTENSLSFLFFDEPEIFSEFFNYLDKIKEKQEIKDKMEKIKLSQKLNNF